MSVMAQMFLICGIIVASLIPLVLYICKGKTFKFKMVLWGITTMIIFSPIVSWTVAIMVATLEKDGFAAVAMIFLLFPTIFLTGIVLILVGIFKKKKPVPTDIV